MIKNKIILFLFIMFLFCNITKGVTFYDTGELILELQGGYSFSFLELDGDSFQIDGLDIIISGLNSDMVINISSHNSGLNLSSGTSVLRFNATYSGGNNVVFVFNGNHTNSRYDLFVDGSSYSHSDSDNQISFTINSWSDHDIDIILDGYYPDPPFNGSSVYTSSLNTVNLTWSRGNYSDREVLVGKSSGYPSSLSDGTVWQNSTLQFYNFTVNQTQYFTVWSYNDTTKKYSHTGLNLEWGALRLNVFNASKEWQQVDPFGLIIQNQAGTDTYTNPVCFQPFYLDINEMPTGSDTMFILNASGYKQSEYAKDVLVNHFYNFTFLMTPVTTSTPGEGDDDPVTGEPGNETEAQNYVVIVEDELGQYVGKALVVVKQYNNFTDSYDEIGSGLTGDGGSFSISLVPGVQYQITVSKDGYVTSSGNYWTPDRIEFGDERYYTIVLNFEEDDITPEVSYSTEIVFTAVISDNVLYINYTDNLCQTINSSIYVYEVNGSTKTMSLFTSYTSIDNCSWSISYDVNSSNSYHIYLFHNHSVFGMQKQTIIIDGGFNLPTLQEVSDTLFELNYGSNPFGWSNVFTWIFLVAVYFKFGQAGAGLGLVISGFLLLFLNLIIGFNTMMVVVAGGVIPSMHIILGAGVIWLNMKKRGVVG